MKKHFLSILIVFLFITGLKAEQVHEIIIIGNDRVSKETILLLGDIEKNVDYDESKLNKVLNELYKTNFFSNISLEIVNGTLKVNVVENKIIQSVQINGIKNKTTAKQIKEILFLKDKTPFNKFYAEKDLRVIKNSLKNSGYYFVEVKSTLVENNNNTVNLIYDVELGKKARIGKIVFLGNNNFKDNKLRKVIVSEEDKFWKFVSRKRYINPETINLDKRLLKNFYLNKGYFNVQINEAFAQFQENNSFTLTYNIIEGSKYFINKTKLILPTDYDEKNFTEINKSLKKLENKKYSFSKLSKILNALDKVTLLKQYEFITATLNEEIIDKNKINISLLIDETEKKYIERIDIVGNNVTIESVIRNEFVVDEGDAYNELLVAKSINNLKARNIFKEVNQKVISGSEPSLKILEINVEEKPTGEIQIGAGVGTEGTSFGFSVSENNYMGKGIRLDTSFQASEERLTGLFSLYNPNFNYSDNSLSTIVQSTVTDRMDNYGYKSSNTGITLGTGFEQYDDFTISPTFSVGLEKLETNQSASDNLKKQEGSYFDATISYSLDYDKRNQRFQTSDGFRSKFSQSIPLVSEDYALMNGYEYSKYQQIGSDDVVASLLLYTRSINSLTDEDVRVSNRLYLPSRKLRGFEAGKIGPKDSGDYVGGNYATAINLVTTMPKLFSELQNAEFQFFFDAANVWGVDYSDTIDDSNTIRTSAGVAVNWYTLIGPLNFSLAQPITKASGDTTESFRFNLGTTF